MQAACREICAACCTAYEGISGKYAAACNVAHSALCMSGSGDHFDAAVTERKLVTLVYGHIHLEGLTAQAKMPCKIEIVMRCEIFIAFAYNYFQEEISRDDTFAYLI